MAHILIFDNTATVDSNGDAIDMSFPTRGGTVGCCSVPVRIYGSPDGDIEKCGLEMVAIGTANEAFTMQWFLEYNNDAPARDQSITFGSARHVPPTLGIAATSQWNREVTSELAGSGVINHYPVTRQSAFNPGIVTGNVECHYYPMLVHGVFFRVRFLGFVSAPTTIPRILVFAVVGGYDEQDAIEASVVPWVGTAGGVLVQPSLP